MFNLETIECDGCDANSGYKYVGTGTHRHELAHKLSQSPSRHQHLHQDERLREETECQVGDGQVDDENVTRSSHGCVARHDETHETVAERAERDEQREERYQNPL